MDRDLLFSKFLFLTDLRHFESSKLVYKLMHHDHTPRRGKLQPPQHTSLFFGWDHVCGVCTCFLLAMGQDLGFFSAKIYSLWFRTQNFFPQQFICYGSGLRFFYTKIYSLWFRTQKFFSNFFLLWLRSQDLNFFSQKFLQYGSGLRFFSAKIYSLWFRT